MLGGVPPIPPGTRAVAKRFVATVVRWFAVAKPPQGRGGNAMVRKQSVHVKGLVVTGVTHIK